MDEEPKEGFPKQPCKTCGPTEWNPEQTRRDLLKNAALVGIGIVTVGALLTSSASPASADSSVEDLIEQCGIIHAVAIANCVEEYYDDVVARSQCEAKAEIAYWQCMMDVASKHYKEILAAAIGMLATLLVYTSVVIAGITLIVLSWALILAAAVAALALAAEALAAGLAAGASAATIAALLAAFKAAQDALHQAQQGAAGLSSNSGVSIA